MLLTGEVNPGWKMLKNNWSKLVAAGLVMALLAGCGGTRKQTPVTGETELAPIAKPLVTMGTVVKTVGTPVQLTSSESDNGLGSFNPAGDKITFQSNRDGRWQIYEYNLADSAIIHLISSEANDENPIWSLDSSGVLFVSDRNGAGNEWGRDILFFDPASNVVANIADSRFDDWFPAPLDRQSFLFLTERDADSSLAPYLKPHSLYKGFMDGRPAERIAGTDVDPSCPAKFDDDRLLVRTKDARLALLNSRDNSLEKLTPEDIFCGTITYHRGIGVIAFNARKSGDYQLYLLDPVNMVLQQIDTGNGDVRFPQFAPDGKSLVYSQEVNGKFQLFRLALAQ
jgi:Tol biopolymer transport system component